MTRQAMQLGWLPGVAIRQTSDRMYGQIYVPVVNWLLMTATIATTMAFGSSDRLAGAYVTAVSTTMLLTTVLLYRAMRDVWKWSHRRRGQRAAAVFVLVDGSFFLANLPKIADGGWPALELRGGVVRHHDHVARRHGRDTSDAGSRPPQARLRLLSDLKNGLIPRVAGTTVFLDQESGRRCRG